LKQKRSGEPDKNVTGLTDILRSSYRKLRGRHTISSLLAVVGIMAGGFALLVALENYLYLPAAFKTSYWVALILFSLVTGYFIYRRKAYGSFREFCSRLADARSLPELKNAIDFIYNDRSEQSPFLDLALEQNLEKVKHADLKSKTGSYVSESSVTKQMKRLGAFTLVAVLAVTGTALTITDSLNRSLQAWKTFQKPNPFTYSVTPGSVTLEQGDAFTPAIRFEGEQPGDLKLAFKTDIEQEYRTRLPSQSVGDSVTFASLSLPTGGSYYFEMDGYESEAYRAEVQLLPRFETLAVTVAPPAYTRLDSSRYTYPFSQVRAYRGSEIHIKGKANKSIPNLSVIRQQNSDTLQLSPEDGQLFTHTFQMTATDTLRFTMRDEHGLSNKNPFEFVVEPIEDEAPFVQLLRPENDLEMKNPEALQLEYEASDDFGITSVRLNYEIQRAFKQNAEQQSLSIPVPALNRTEQFSWDVPGLNPKPRDMISFWVEVTDNDRINGSKTTRSRTLTITFPSLTDFVNELETRESTAQDKLRDVSDSYEQMKEEYDRFKEQLRQNPQGDWQQQQTLEEVKKQQEAIDRQVEDLNKEFEQLRRDLEESDLLSDETRKAYEELQQLMKEIDDPELMKALEELQKSLGNLSQEELRKALENYEFNEQQYQERLERTVELFKTLKLNSDLEKLGKAFEELSREEQNLSEESPESSEQLNRQEAVKRDLEQLQEELEKLGENPPQKARKQIEELQDNATRDMEQTKQELQENIEKLQDDSTGENDSSVRQQQQRIQQQLEKLAEQMQNAQQQLNQQRQQVNITALQYILHSLINLSQNQEKLSRETEALSYRSQAFVEKARDEKQIQQQFTRIADSLFQVSSEIPSFSNSINRKKNSVQDQLQTAVEMLAERDKSKATFAERQSLGGINELTTMIASLLDQLQNSQGQGGGGAMTMQQFMEQMQQMSGQQQQLNQQIQDFINDIQGDRLSQDQVERLNQMARQQNEIRKQIKELQQKGGLESGDQVLSELERLSEEMEQTINDLRGGETDPFMIKRQQNILSRMLNAEKALQERGEEEKREGTTAEDSPSGVPPDVTIEELQKEIRKLMNDPNRTRFSEDYQRLIEQYFELLKNLQTGQDSTSIN